MEDVMSLAGLSCPAAASQSSTTLDPVPGTGRGSQTPPPPCGCRGGVTPVAGTAGTPRLRGSASLPPARSTSPSHP